MNMDYSLEKNDTFAAMAEKDPNTLISLMNNKETSDDNLIILAESAGLIADEGKVVPTLLKLLDHKNPEVREAAVYGIGCFISETVTDALIDVIAHDENETVKEAARNMPAVEYLLETIDSSGIEGDEDGSD